MYFVHGLNGHAFDAFCSRQYDDDKGCMWARDLLPDDHQKHRIFGRYSTFGYDARINMQKEEEFDLTNIAREFLGEIEAQRRHVSGTRQSSCICLWGQRITVSFQSCSSVIVSEDW